MHEIRGPDLGAAHLRSSASTQLSIALRHLGMSLEEAQLHERLASRVFHADRSMAAGPEIVARNVMGQSSLWSHGISGDLPILLVRVLEPDDLALVRQVLRAQDYWRLKGLSADVVILNEHPVSYRNEIHDQLGALLESGIWGAWKNRTGGAFLLAREGMSDADAILLSRGGARGAERRRGNPRGAARPSVCRSGVAVRARDRRAPGTRARR